MLSRLIPKSSHLRRLVSISSNIHPYAQPHFTYSSRNPTFITIPKFFSTNNNNNNGQDKSASSIWNISRESEGKLDSFFTEEPGDLSGITDSLAGADSAGSENQSWLNANEKDEDDIFKGTEKEIPEKSDDNVENQWTTVEESKPWRLVEEEKSDLFNIGDDGWDGGAPGDHTSSLETESIEVANIEEAKKLETEEKELTAILKGPNRAFGDLIAASGITDEMLDTLIALKGFEGVEGLPPLSTIEDMRYEKNTRKSSRAEIERQKQEELAKARVRQVDEKGRAYGTGKRKCSIARVWIQPGNGKFMVNDKEFDVYFPVLDNRAALLRPFSETKTLGLWDVNCTVKGGGVSGQVGAIQLGVSRALQNWEPDYRPALRAVGFLTRDSRVVERKKPGKAKARKSFQWVKR
ncbi:Ribosomal protein S9 [Quillaja saponaria]|uniref:Ribosomal protein S9 n=1 Tax=Quillaja saponaria TaxID=32244 RepID=A0AAD7M4N0_QUISA|nr:Ribosomal protein S9 [Quillaja saponaria]KAJ7969905.1 Ribosomal protein S9 [Quillaja saponaria]